MACTRCTSIPLLVFATKQIIIEGTVSEHVEFTETVLEVTLPAPRKGYSSVWAISATGNPVKMFEGDPEYAGDMYSGLLNHDHESTWFVVHSRVPDDIALVLVHSQGLDCYDFLPEQRQLLSPASLPD